MGEVQEMIEASPTSPIGQGAHALRPDDCILNARAAPHVRAIGIRWASSEVISAFNFPVAVWAWNSFLAAVNV